MFQPPQQPPIGYPTHNASSVPQPHVVPLQHNEQLGFADFLAMLRRHRIAFAASVFLSIVVAVVFALNQTPRYTAWADLLIDLRKPNILEGSGGVVPDIPVGTAVAAAAIRSEVALIGSRGMVEKVVDQLGLTQDPEFNSRLRNELAEPPTGLAAWATWAWETLSPGALMATVERMFRSDDEGGSDLEIGSDVDPERARVMRAVARNLSVANDGRSFVLSIGFSSEYPNKAALIANTFADEYLASQVRLKQEALTRAQTWLNERIATLRADIEQSNAAMQDLREAEGIVRIHNGTATAQQVAELTSQLILAQAGRAQAEARLRSALQLRSNSGRYDGTLEVVQAQAVQALKEQEGTLRRQQAELSSSLGPRHPEMLRVRAELEAVRQKIDEEIDVVVRSLQNEVNVAVSRVESLQQALDTLEGRASDSGRTEMRLEQMDLEADTSRQLLDSVLSRYKELLEQTGLQEADARVISQAEKPPSPVGLGRKQIVAAGLGLGVILGIIVVLALEQVSRGFRTADEAERMIGVPVLGLVPRLRFGRWRNPIDYVADKPLSVYAEALRRLFATVRLVSRLRPGSVIVVSSALPGEGKTTLVMSLARILAGAGVRTLVIEGDLRRPSLSRVIDHEAVTGEEGLCAVLAGQADLQTAVTVDGKSGAHILLAGRPSATDPADLLDPRRVRALFDDARRRYDLVLVDTAPVMVISDSIVMAEQADAVLLAARWSRTPRKLVAKAASLLRECGANLIGTVLSRVEVEAEGEVGAVYKSARRYYAN